MINSTLLKNRMAELGVSQREVAKKLGISRTNLCQKINNTRKMSIRQMLTLSEILGLSPGEYKTYFDADPESQAQKNVNEA